ncbi:cellulose binding domain-containing protein, partial [Klebsiella pneumoniae]|uniref:cellulose binding domain-containing protein n=1 Tax=Klebsiella pneumoniae TaxID=573 RepID=UPI003013584C
AADTNATDQQIKPHLNIVNTGATAVPLSELTVRYWYTKDTTQVQVYDCDFAVPGCANITASVVTLSTPVATADTYLR